MRQRKTAFLGSISSALIIAIVFMGCGGGDEGGAEAGVILEDVSEDHSSHIH